MVHGRLGLPSWQCAHCNDAIGEVSSFPQQIGSGQGVDRLAYQSSLLLLRSDLSRIRYDRIVDHLTSAMLARQQHDFYVPENLIVLVLRS